ncbi:MAG: metal-dependent hydrolase [Planctomycetota bacterium]
MTPIGHSLTGVAVALAALEPRATRRATRRVTLKLVALGVTAANVPDLPLPGWGHDRYQVSHSVFVAAAVLGGIAVAGVAAPSWRNALGGWRAYAVLAVAWLSHLLLDTFYNHGRGVALLWPVSDARLALPIPWFATAGGVPPPPNWHTLRVLLIEAFCYGAVVAIAAWLRAERIAKR